MWIFIGFGVGVVIVWVCIFWMWLFNIIWIGFIVDVIRLFVVVIGVIRWLILFDCCFFCIFGGLFWIFLFFLVLMIILVFLFFCGFFLGFGCCILFVFGMFFIRCLRLSLFRICVWRVRLNWVGWYVGVGWGGEKIIGGFIFGINMYWGLLLNGFLINGWNVIFEGMLGIFCGVVVFIMCCVWF